MVRRAVFDSRLEATTSFTHPTARRKAAHEPGTSVVLGTSTIESTRPVRLLRLSRIFDGAPETLSPRGLDSFPRPQRTRPRVRCGRLFFECRPHGACPFGGASLNFRARAYLRGSLAQLVEQETFNLLVDGSNPSRPIPYSLGKKFILNFPEPAWERTSFFLRCIFSLAENGRHILVPRSCDTTPMSRIPRSPLAL